VKKTNSLSEFSQELSYDVVAAMKECFQQMDTNGDGELSKVELGQVMRSLGINHTEAEINILFKELDTDKSNTISFKEFLGGLRWISRSSQIKEKSTVSQFVHNIDQLQLETMTQIFHELDTDKSGCLSEIELSAMIHKLGINGTEEDISNLFKSLDLNADGKIELQEFLSGMKWLKKGINISSKIEQPKTKQVTISQDKQTINDLQEKNTILTNYLKAVIERSLKTASNHCRTNDNAVAKEVVDILDWDTLSGLELFVGTLTNEKQKELHSKIAKRVNKK